MFYSITYVRERERERIVVEYVGFFGEYELETDGRVRRRRRRRRSEIQYVIRRNDTNDPTSIQILFYIDTYMFVYICLISRS